MSLTPEEFILLSQDEKAMYAQMESEERVEKMLGCECEACQEEYQFRMIGQI